MNKYKPEEILQILIDFYNFQVEFDPEVDKGKILNFETSIGDWRMICDLIKPKKLAKHYHKFFELKTSLSDLEKLLRDEDSNNIGDFCNYISKNAKKTEIKPVISLGEPCITASIFKELMDKFTKHGINTSEITPSSKFIPLFNKHINVFMEEVNKLAPGSLTRFEYRDNRIVRIGNSIIGISILLLILITLIWGFHWITLLFGGIGIITTMIGRRFKPEKEIIGGYETIRDLIKGIRLNLEKTAT